MRTVRGALAADRFASGSLSSIVTTHMISNSQPFTLPSRRFMSRALRIATALFVGAGSVTAQQQQASSSATKAKPVLGSADYAKWETLSGAALSPDGKWVAYDFRRGNGSTELRYRTVDSDNEHVARSANGPQFTSNGHWLLYTITPDTTAGGG